MIADMIQKYILAPVFPDDEDSTRRARTLNLLIWGVGVLVLGQTFAEVFQHGLQHTVPAILLAAGFLLVIAAQVILRRGHILVASRVIVFGFWFLDTLRVFTPGHPSDIYVSLYITLIVYALLLLGRVPAIVMITLSSAVAISPLVTTIAGAVPLANLAVDSMPQWLVFTWSAILVVVVLRKELDRLSMIISERQTQIEERRYAEKALKNSEEKYRLLFENMVEGFSFHEIILDEDEKPVDYRFLEINPAFEQLTGLKAENVIGRKALDVLPNLEPEWIERYGQVALTGKPVSFENHAQELNKYYSVKAYSPKHGYFATSFEDITKRKQMENEQNQAAEEEHKRHEALEKLREVSTNMRQAEGSNGLLQVFTSEVNRLCESAEVTSSLLFKGEQEPITCLDPEADIELSQEQTDAIRKALLGAKSGTLEASIPGFETVFVLQLQSSDAVHGAVLIASRGSHALSPDQRNLLNATADMAGTALNRIDIWETLEDRVRQRTRNLVVLYNLITIISENWHLQDLLELSLMLTLETVDANRGIIYLTDERDASTLKPVIQRGFSEGFEVEAVNLPDIALAQEVFKMEKPVSRKSLGDDSAFAEFKGVTSYVAIPILARGEVRGVFSLFANEKEAFEDEEMALLVSIADHLGIGIENTILYERSRESAALEERNRLARDLHDSVSQLLYSLTLMTGTTKRMLERGSDLAAVKNSVDRLGDTAHRALKEMRLLLFELRPAVLESEGLVGALRHRIKTVEEGLGMQVDLQADGLPELPSYMEDALYHIAMEAFNNIVKHADSKSAAIKFTSKDGTVLMEISDEGKGFDTDLLQIGLGLRNMRERGQMLGSEVVVESKPGEGTHVTVEVKVPPSSPESA